MARDLVVAIEARLGHEPFSTSWGYHSRVSTANRYVCMTIPKVGCTTVKRTLRAWEGLPQPEDWGDLHADDRHPTLAHFSSTECATMLAAADWTTFAFVRNPYDRLFSAWKSKLANRSDRQYVWLRDSIRREYGYPTSSDGFVPFVAFADFARYVATTTDARAVHDGHLDLQTNVLILDIIDYDVLGRFETFARDFATILRRLDAPADVAAMACEVTNATPHLPLAAAYDRDLADVVYEKYAADFDAFGYERDSWMYD